MAPCRQVHQEDLVVRQGREVRKYRGYRPYRGVLRHLVDRVNLKIWDVRGARMKGISHLWDQVDLQVQGVREGIFGMEVSVEVREEGHLRARVDQDCRDDRVHQDGHRVPEVRGDLEGHVDILKITFLEAEFTGAITHVQQLPGGPA